MDLQIELKNGVMTAMLFGELDHHTVSRIRQEIDDAALKVKPRILRLDFTNGTGRKKRIPLQEKTARFFIWPVSTANMRTGTGL